MAAITLSINEWLVLQHVLQINPDADTALGRRIVKGICRALDW